MQERRSAGSPDPPSSRTSMTPKAEEDPAGFLPGAVPTSEPPSSSESSGMDYADGGGDDAAAHDEEWQHHHPMGISCPRVQRRRRSVAESYLWEEDGRPSSLNDDEDGDDDEGDDDDHDMGCSHRSGGSISRDKNICGSADGGSDHADRRIGGNESNEEDFSVGKLLVSNTSSRGGAYSWMMVNNVEKDDGDGSGIPDDGSANQNRTNLGPTQSSNSSSAAPALRKGTSSSVTLHNDEERLSIGDGYNNSLKDHHHASSGSNSSDEKPGSSSSGGGNRNKDDTEEAIDRDVRPAVERLRRTRAVVAKARVRRMSRSSSDRSSDFGSRRSSESSSMMESALGDNAFLEGEPSGDDNLMGKRGALHRQHTSVDELESRYATDEAVKGSSHRGDKARSAEDDRDCDETMAHRKPHPNREETDNDEGKADDESSEHELGNSESTRFSHTAQSTPKRTASEDSLSVREAHLLSTLSDLKTRLSETESELDACRLDCLVAKNDAEQLRNDVQTLKETHSWECGLLLARIESLEDEGEGVGSTARGTDAVGSSRLPPRMVPGATLTPQSSLPLHSSSRSSSSGGAAASPHRNQNLPPLPPHPSRPPRVVPPSHAAPLATPPPPPLHHSPNSKLTSLEQSSYHSSNVDLGRSESSCSDSRLVLPPRFSSMGVPLPPRSPHSSLSNCGYASDSTAQRQPSSLRYRPRTGSTGYSSDTPATERATGAMKSAPPTSRGSFIRSTSPILGNKDLHPPAPPLTDGRYRSDAATALPPLSPRKTDGSPPLMKQSEQGRRRRSLIRRPVVPLEDEAVGGNDDDVPLSPSAGPQRQIIAMQNQAFQRSSPTSSSPYRNPNPRPRRGSVAGQLSGLLRNISAAGGRTLSGQESSSDDSSEDNSQDNGSRYKDGGGSNRSDHSESEEDTVVATGDNDNLHVLARTGSAENPRPQQRNKRGSSPAAGGAGAAALPCIRVEGRAANPWYKGQQMQSEDDNGNGRNGRALNQSKRPSLKKGGFFSSMTKLLEQEL